MRRAQESGTATSASAPDEAHADKGYDFTCGRQFLSRRGIRVRIARRKVESSQRLGRHRWMVERSLAVSFVGSSETIMRGLSPFIDSLKPDELMITAHIFDQAARLRSIELVAEVRDRLGAPGNSAKAG